MLLQLNEAFLMPTAFKSEIAARYATYLIYNSGSFPRDLPYKEDSHCQEPQSDKYQGEFESTDGPGFPARRFIRIRDDTLVITSRRYSIICFGGGHQALPIVDFLGVPES